MRHAAVTLSCMLLVTSIWSASSPRIAASGADPAGVSVTTGQRTQPPARLSETGLYADAAALRVDARNRAYAPQYPLWTDGARKSRWAYLPPGTTIDARRTDDWVFPAGTRFWKEFAFGDRRVETRMLWKASDTEWVFATYVWNDEQTDATLAPEAGVPDAYEIAPGKTFSIPGVRDCHACHDGRRTQVLGFGALQLSTDRDPHAPHADPLTPDMVTLKTLVEERRFDPPRDDFLTSPPRIEADTPRTRAVLGYLSANCGGCHNAESPLAPLGLLLRHASHADGDTAQPALASTIDRASRYEMPGVDPGAARRIAPGAPDHSTLLYRMRSRRPASQMPPLGTSLPDREAIALVERWIAEDLGQAPVTVVDARPHR